MADSDAYESVLCVKAEVHVYRIPPRASNRGYRAADWKLDQPDWTGRMRVTAKGTAAFIKLEDRTSGELFAQAPVDAYPGLTVESVKDSSRYFVLRIQDGGAGRSAFIGIGFADRGDAFDFSVALQDHFKWVKQESELAKQMENPDSGPKLDLGFKDGETIKLNIGHMKKKEGLNPKPRAAAGSSIFLPPPPGGKIPPLAPPPCGPPPSAPPPPQTPPQHRDLLMEFDSFGSSRVTTAAAGGEDTLGVTPTPAAQSSSSNAWVQF